MTGVFPGGLVVRIQCFCCHGPGSNPGQGTEIPQAEQHSQNLKEKRLNSSAGDLM